MDKVPLQPLGLKAQRRNNYEKCKNTIFYRVQCTLFYVENDAEIYPAQYTWKVAEKGFKMAYMMNKFAMINPCEIIFET